MAQSVKEKMSQQLNKSFETSKKKNRLLDKLPIEELEENQKQLEQEPIINDPLVISEQIQSFKHVGKLSGKKEVKPIGLMIYLHEDIYDLFETMLNKGKRYTKSELGLTFQQGELVTLMTEFFYERVYSNKQDFNQKVIDLVAKRKQKN